MKQLTLITAILALLCTTEAFGQLDWKFGGGLSFGTEISAIGLQLRANADIDETWNAAGSFTYFFEDVVNWWDLNFDAHYNFAGDDDGDFYAIGGINITHIGVDVDFGPFGSFGASSTEFGLNLGAGYERRFSDSLCGFGELKYIVSSANQLVISAGVLFAIN